MSIRQRAVLPSILVALMLGACGSQAEQSGDEVAEDEALEEAEQQSYLEPEIHHLVSQATFPVAMAFAPDGRLFFTEKAGNVRVVSNIAAEILQPQPVITLPTDSLAERGMLGIAIDPNFEQNHYIWVYHTAPPTEEVGLSTNQVVRFTERDGVGSNPEIALSVPIQEGNPGVHNGGNIHFGPDGMLYVSIGDYFDAIDPQDVDTMPGKIHRFVPDVPLGIPEDNPIPDSSIYALGFRNPFDFTFDPLTDTIFATENGPECNDELNLIVPGGNYGWAGPDTFECGNRDFLDEDYPYEAPLMNFRESNGISGITIYEGEEFPEWEGKLIYCTWTQGAMFLVTLNEARDEIVSTERVRLARENATCQIDVLVGPDGRVYFTSAGTIYFLSKS